MSVSEVQVENKDRERTKYDNQQEIEIAIWDEIHRKRLFLTEQAPICQENLRGSFGNLELTLVATAVLDETYEYPPDMDASTKELFMETATICCIIPKNLVSFLITLEK